MAEEKKIGAALTAESIAGEYDRASRWDAAAGYPEEASKSLLFYEGNQWEGVGAPDLPKPVFNILKRVVNYFIAMLVTDDITARADASENAVLSPDDSLLLKALNGELNAAVEGCDLKSKLRRLLRDTAVTGNGALYFRYDPKVKTGHSVSGRIEAENIAGEQIYFGDPHEEDIEKQPYLILWEKLPRAVCGRKWEIPQDKLAALRGDEEDRVLLLHRFWKENGEVCTADVLSAGRGEERTFYLTEPHSLGLFRYPAVYLRWESRRGSYRGRGAVYGLIPNQIYINKLFAMAMVSITNTAFPKIAYDKTRVGSWDNRVGGAIGVIGDVESAVARPISGADMSPQVMPFIRLAMNETKELMGASDAALGSVSPENTSAILAVQRATAVPLELQRLAFYQAVEDAVRIFSDMIRVYYGAREAFLPSESGEKTARKIDYRRLDDLILRLSVDVGASTYWSEILQSQTLDNLFLRGIITPEEYLSRVPDAFIRDKAALIERMKKESEEPVSAGMLPAKA